MITRVSLNGVQAARDIFTHIGLLDYHSVKTRQFSVVCEPLVWTLENMLLLKDKT